MRILQTTSLLLLATVSAALHAAPVASDHVTVELISENTALIPGRTAWLGLRLQHAPQWHTYWINPGDSGLPTRLTWTLPSGFTAGDIDWPAPRRFKIDELYNFGYAGDVLLPVPIDVPAHAVPGATVHLAVQAKWLVCHEECIPGKASLALNLPVAATAASNARAQVLFAAARAAQAQVSPSQAQARLLGDRVEVIVEGAHLAQTATLDAFAVQTKVVANAPPTVVIRDGSSVLTFAKSDYFTSIPDRFDLLLRDDNAHASLLHAHFAGVATATDPATRP